jgi:transcriptional regulator GlxA family with amidase domain
MIEPLRAANEVSNSDAFEWQLIAETLAKVPSSARIDFEPVCTLETAQGLDLLILLSAPTATFQDDRSIGRLRSMQRHGLKLGAVSGGVFPLVRAGVAGNAKLAVHWCYSAAFDAEFPNQIASDRVIETTNTVITAAGAAAAFDLSLSLIEEKLGPGVATEVACWFQHPVMRRQGVVQSVPSLKGDAAGRELSPLVARAAQIFSQNISEPISIAEVADMVGITPRHMERAFKSSVGLNPTQYYRKLRMEAARQIVCYTNDRISDIAGSVGYSSLQTFAKHYRNAFDVTPKEDRNQINLFRVKENLPVPSV